MTNLGRINFGPLSPSTVGFERFFDAFDQLTVDKIPTNTFPPHNIVKIDDYNYQIELAVAGFKISDIDIEVLKGELTISGKRTELSDKYTYLHRGIGARSFKKIVRLSDSVKVDGATLEDGILTVKLHNIIPEENQPKRIPIVSSGNTQVFNSESGNKKLLQE